MISIVATSVLAQSSLSTITDQELSLSVSTVGEFGTPIGVVKDPLIVGDFSISKKKDENTNSFLYRLQLKLRRGQSKIVSILTDGLSEKKETREQVVDTYKDKDFAYFIGSYRLAKEDYKISSVMAYTNEYYMSSAVLDPLSMTLGIISRSLNSPELRKEFPLLEDGPRKYSITFRPNLNANTESVPGDAAYKFDIRLKDESGDYPGFFSGAIRLNVGTKLVQYLTASSDPDHQPKPPADADLGANKSYQIRLEAKKPKA